MQNFTSPMANFYRNQMNNLAGGYNYTPQYINTPSQVAQPPVNEFPCRPVTGIEEARAAMLTNGYTPHVYTDLGNNKIYVKQTDNMGNARFATFAYVPENTQNTQPIQAEEVKGVDVSSIQADIESKFKEKIEFLENNIQMLNNEIESLKGGLLNDKSTNDTDDTNIKNGTKSNGRNAKNVS